MLRKFFCDFFYFDSIKTKKLCTCKTNIVKKLYRETNYDASERFRFLFVKKIVLGSKYSEYTTLRNVIFSWRSDVYMCARVCPIFNVSNPDNSWTAWDIDMKFGDYFRDNWCVICDFIGFWIFWKISMVALTFVKFELSPWGYTQIYCIYQGPLILNLAKIDWSVQIFWDVEFLENLLKIFYLRFSSYRAEILCGNALILNYVLY